MFEYVPRPIGGETGRFVESIWFARGRIQGVRERIAPTGSTVAAVVLGDPIRQTPDGDGPELLADTGFLIGPHDRPIVNEPQGETYCVGIVTTPVGCRPAFGLAPVALRGRVVDLLHAWPRAVALRRELSMCTSPNEMLDLVEATLDAPEAFDVRAFDRCEAAAAQLAADPTRPIADIAAGLGVSHGHLDRQFTEHDCSVRRSDAPYAGRTRANSTPSPPCSRRSSRTYAGRQGGSGAGPGHGRSCPALTMACESSC